MPKKGQFSICTIDGCDRRMLARGFCDRHYQQQKKAGLIEPLRVIPVPERFWAKVERTESCWLWRAAVLKSGYGSFGVPGRGPVYAHRFSYELNVGPIPGGLHIDHLCRVRTCVRPDHLEAVTQQENNRREFAAVTHCPAGHAYEGDNLYVDTTGGRRCRRCSNEKTQAKRNATVVRVRFHGHTPERLGHGDWRCRCGRVLGSTQGEALIVMREAHVPELRAALATT